MAEDFDEEFFEGLPSGGLPSGIIRSREQEPSATPARPVSGKTSPSLSPTRENRITAMEVQERDRDRVSIFIDGKFAIGIFADLVSQLMLRVGQQITPERLEEITQAELRRKAREDAYRLLSFRARSEGELTDRLRRKGYEEEVIRETLASLKEYGFVNDESFSASWVASRGKTRGRQALAFELRQKGVARETVRETLEERSESEEFAAARAAAIKRVGEKPSDRSREGRAKLAAYLARRGFGWDTVRPVLAGLYGPSEEENEEFSED